MEEGRLLVPSGSVVGEQLWGGDVEVRVVGGAARRGQHHVGVARELRHLAAAGLGLPAGVRETLLLERWP